MVIVGSTSNSRLRKKVLDRKARLFQTRFMEDNMRDKLMAAKLLTKSLLESLWAGTPFGNAAKANLVEAARKSADKCLARWTRQNRNRKSCLALEIEGSLIYQEAFNSVLSSASVTHV